MRNSSINLLFAGDFIPPENTDNIYSDDLKAVLKNKDFSIVNLETPLTERGKKIVKTGMNFRRSPSTVKHIKEGYFDAVCLSNNHIRDYGDEGVLDTIETCNQNNIQTVGAGKNIEEAQKPLRIEIKGKKISILNYSEREFNIADDNTAGANPYDTINAFYDIQIEKQENDYVIVVYHGGLEFHHVPLPGIKRNLEFMIDNGADAVVSHHTHVVSPIKYHKGNPICYGLGNFCFDYKILNTLKLHQGLITKLTIDNNSIKHETIPVFYNKNIKVIQKMNNKMLYRFNENLKYYGNLINNNENFNEYWYNNLNSLTPKYLVTLKYGGGFLGKVVKKLNIPFLYKRNILAKRNLIHCDSHREVLINSINNYYNK